MIPVAEVDAGSLFELVWAGLLAALTVVFAWGLVVHGTTRASEARREGRSGAATLHAVVAIAGGALFTAAVVFGLVVMTSKG